MQSTQALLIFTAEVALLLLFVCALLILHVYQLRRRLSHPQPPKKASTSEINDQPKTHLTRPKAQLDGSTTALIDPMDELKDMVVDLRQRQEEDQQTIFSLKADNWRLRNQLRSALECVEEGGTIDPK